MANKKPPKDPDDVEVYAIIFCDKTNLNSGSNVLDFGYLQGETISSATWTVPSGITKDAQSLAEITIKGITYVINTVAAITLSSGTDNTDYTLDCKIVTSGGRTKTRSIIIPVRESNT